MIDNFRQFQATDPEGRVWDVEFLWQQNAISIRHANGVDVKFRIKSGAETAEKVVELPLQDLVEESRRENRPITDPWVSRLAAEHLKRAIEGGWDDPCTTRLSWEADRPA